MNFPPEVASHIKAFISKDRNFKSPTAAIMKAHIKLFPHNDLTISWSKSRMKELYHMVGRLQPNRDNEEVREVLRRMYDISMFSDLMFFKTTCVVYHSYAKLLHHVFPLIDNDVMDDPTNFIM